MKYINLFESFSSQKMIQKFALSILRYIANNAELTTRGIEVFDWRRGSYDYKSPIEIDDKNFDNYLIRNKFQGVRFVDLKDSKGAYNNEKECVIYLNRKKDLFKYLDNVDILTDKTKEDILDVLYKNYYSILIHELQHAYDDYLSGGKFLKTKKTNIYNDKIKKGILDFDYYELPHEINARFTQAINDMNFFNVDYDLETDTQTVTKKTFQEAKKYFEEHAMKHYEILDDNVKKRLIKRLYQYWQLAED
jgi:hypothetical protein